MIFRIKPRAIHKKLFFSKSGMFNKLFVYFNKNVFARDMLVWHLFQDQYLIVLLVRRF